MMLRSERQDLKGTPSLVDILDPCFLGYLVIFFFVLVEGL